MGVSLGSREIWGEFWVVNKAELCFRDLWHLLVMS